MSTPQRSTLADVEIVSRASPRDASGNAPVLAGADVARLLSAVEDELLPDLANVDTIAAELRGLAQLVGALFHASEEQEIDDALVYVQQALRVLARRVEVIRPHDWGRHYVIQAAAERAIGMEVL